jgi:hypothetical protein
MKDLKKSFINPSFSLHKKKEESDEVRDCSTQEHLKSGLDKCPLYPYRLGSDPTAAKKGVKPPCGYVSKIKTDILPSQ